MSFFHTLVLYFWGGGERRLWLLYGLAKWFHDRDCLRAAKIVNFKVQREFGCYLSLTSQIDPTVRFPHPVGIVIGAGVKVGAECVIYQGVTIGGKRVGDWQTGAYPVIGNRVTIFSGAQILGKISVGDQAVIGSNSVVNKKVLAGAVVAGVPAKIIKSNNCES